MSAELVRGGWAAADTQGFILGSLWKLGKFFRVIQRWSKSRLWVPLPTSHCMQVALGGDCDLGCGELAQSRPFLKRADS